MIKNLLQSIVASAAAFVLTPYLVTGFKLDGTVESIIVAAVVLVLVNFFVKPIITLVSFPINLITMGFFGLVINALMLWLTSYLVGGIAIEPVLLYFNYFGANLPVIQLPSPWLTLFAAAFLMRTIYWLLRKILL